jgi:hypothetical protein
VLDPQVQYQNKLTQLREKAEAMKQMQQMLESVVGGGGEHNRAQVGAPRTMTRKEVDKFQGLLDTIGTALPSPLSLMTTVSSGLIDFEKAKEDDLGFKGFLGNLLGEDIASALGLPTSGKAGRTGRGGGVGEAGSSAERGGYGGQDSAGGGRGSVGGAAGHDSSSY